MNREILFKAKRVDNGEWVERYYLNIAKINHFICTGKIKLDGALKGIIAPEMYEIDLDTLCQYTGLTDKNGRKIWENDILRGYQYPYRSDGNDNYFAEVTWFENCPAFGIYTFKNPKSNVCGISEGNTEFMENWNSEDWEVIGNIFDNPDLLEAK